MIVTYPMLIAEDPVEGGYTISIPDLPGCITCCQFWEEIPDVVTDAIKNWIIAALEEGIRVPNPTIITRGGMRDV